MFDLSPPSDNQELPGHPFHEHDRDDTARLEDHKWTSWSNKRSFWLTKPALLQVLSERGFTVICEQDHMLGSNIRASMKTGFAVRQGQSLFVAMRSSILWRTGWRGVGERAPVERGAAAHARTGGDGIPSMARAPTSVRETANMFGEREHVGADSTESARPPDRRSPVWNGSRSPRTVTAVLRDGLGHSLWGTGGGPVPRRLSGFRGPYRRRRGPD